MTADNRLAVKEQQTLHNFLTQADLVKFARADAQQDVMQNAFDTVEQFVEQTKEKNAEPQKNAENAKGVA
jgi:predicted HicB family RNase H-like nuclease